MYLNRYLNYFLVFFLVLPVLAYTAYYALNIIDGGHSWKTGDWLINYESGFVRRGLLGHFFYEISIFLNLNILYVTFLFQSLIYFFIVYLTLNLYFKKKRDVFWIVFLISPAFVFFFPFYDTAGGFRKEILGFLAFLILLHGQLLRSNLLKSLSLVLFFIAVYSHELNALLVPFFLYVLVINYSLDYNAKLQIYGAKFSDRLRISAHWLKYTGNLFYVIAFSFVSVSGFILSAVFAGENYQGKLICDSLVNTGLDEKICSDAIAWIGKDAGYGLGRVLVAILENGYAFYLAYLFFSILPFMFFKWFYRKNTLTLIVFSIVALLPLFVFAIDWGRWIHIFIFMLTITLIYESLLNHSIDNLIFEVPFFAKIIIIISYFFWAIPHCCSVELKFGLIETLYKLLQKF